MSKQSISDALEIETVQLAKLTHAYANVKEVMRDSPTAIKYPIPFDQKKIDTMVRALREKVELYQFAVMAGQGDRNVEDLDE